MIRRNDEFVKEERTAMRGGNGTVKMEHIWKKGDGLNSNVRMYSKLILEPGTSIGYHVHENEEEVFLVLEGRAEVTDNGEKAILETGDSIVTRHGESHSVACYGETPLVLLAVILPY